MRFYAERPARAARQLLADVVAIGWFVLWVVLGVAAHDLVIGLGAPARTLADAGEEIHGAFDGAARTVAGIPLVGDDVSRALGAASAAGEALARSGHQQVESVTALATGAGVLVVLLGALPVLLIWLPMRLRYARTAGSAVAARETGTDLLALRALARHPTDRLLAVAPDPVEAWRRDDREVVHRLAMLELATLGLRPPRSHPDAAGRLNG
ncbi:hypothetical protein ACVGVM_25565 [Pseudonocardia bannensis]|uniref:Transmembrane protein n=1 Tax=Pseudonocardia bannensis TaxID=630973 RepID=A0A848DQE1_9PSEU|nr:hypothetical protein [Pseudonocardia bannensis]NMH94765.1 hypothetical protein [Pseudonocardia bannensis]